VSERQFPGMAEPHWVQLCPSDQLKEGGSMVSADGVAVFRHKGKLYALEDKCSHGRGSLSEGDIEDIDPKSVACGSLSGTTACVRCPRHRQKFAGGLWYSMESGESLTLGQTPHHAAIYRVGTFAAKEEGGHVFVSKTASPKSRPLQTSDKIKIRVHKVAKALGCGCMCGTPPPPLKEPKEPKEAKVAKDESGWYEWTVTACSKVSEDCLRIDLKPMNWTVDEGALDLTANHLWHVSVRLQVNGKSVERDYTPTSSLADYVKGHISIWFRVYPNGALTPALQTLLMPITAAVGEDPAAKISSLSLFLSLSLSAPKLTLELPPSHIQPAPDTGYGRVPGGLQAGYGTVTGSPEVPAQASLLLISGGTGLSPILQALDIALARGAGEAGGEGTGHRGGRVGAGAGGAFSSIVLVHSSRTVRDVALFKDLAAALERFSGTSLKHCPTCVHFAFTGIENDHEEKTKLELSVVNGFAWPNHWAPLSVSHGRITANGALSRIWGSRTGICIVSGPQKMLDDVKRVAEQELPGIPPHKLFLLDA